jgi:hypothetical protein
MIDEKEIDFFNLQNATKNIHNEVVTVCPDLQGWVLTACENLHHQPYDVKEHHMVIGGKRCCSVLR